MAQWEMFCFVCDQTKNIIKLTAATSLRGAQTIWRFSTHYYSFELSDSENICSSVFPRC